MNRQSAVALFGFCLLLALATAQLSPVSDQHDPDNAAIKYLRADIALRQSYALPPDAVSQLQHALESPLNAEDDKLVAAADEALVEFQHGALLKTCDWAVSVEDGPFANTSHRGAIGELVAVSGLRARLRFRDGDSAGAIADVLAAMAAARHLSTDGSLASVLLSYRHEVAIEKVISAHLAQLPPKQLSTLSQGLRRLPGGASLADALRSEKLDRDDLLIISKAAETRDELIEQLVRNIPTLSSDRVRAASIVDGCGGTTQGFTECVRGQEAFYRHWATRFALPPEQFETEYKAELEKLTPINPVLKWFTPSLSRMRWPDAYIQTQRALLNAAISVCLRGPAALRDYPDPYDNGQFSYARLDHGFRLESRLSEDGKSPIALVAGIGMDGQSSTPK